MSLVGKLRDERDLKFLQPEKFVGRDGYLRPRCAECPFRKDSAPGWLGPWSIEDFEKMYSGDVNFVCHTSIGKKIEHTCVGYVLLRVNSLKTARDQKSTLGRLERLYKRIAGDNDVFRWWHEFAAHHAVFGVARGAAARSKS